MGNLSKLSDLQEKSDYEKERNIPNYLTKIQHKAKGTIKNISSYLTRFDNYLVETYHKPNETVLSEVLSYSEEKRYMVIFDILQDYANYLGLKENHMGTNKISAGYVRHSISTIRNYLRFFGFKITKEDLADNVTLPRIIEEERVPLVREKLQFLTNEVTGNRRAMYFVMTSSGLRINEVIRLRKRDFILDECERVMVKVSAQISKTRKPRITFISQESERLLKPVLDKINDNDCPFNLKNRQWENHRQQEELVFERIRKKLGYNDRYESGVHHISLTDSFRSWFVTKCNRVDFGFGHALAGHETYMKRYDRMSTKEKVDFYIKAEKTLQVNSYLDEEKTEKMQEVYLNRISALENEMNSIRELLKRKAV